MSIASLITLGIGPGSAIKYVITGGLSVGNAAPVTVDTHDGFVQQPKFKSSREEAARKRREAEQLRRQIEEAAEPPSVEAEETPAEEAREARIVAQAPEEVEEVFAPQPALDLDLQPLAAKIGDFATARKAKALKAKQAAERRAEAERQAEAERAAQAEAARIEAERIAAEEEARLAAAREAQRLLDEENEHVIMLLMAA